MTELVVLGLAVGMPSSAVLVRKYPIKLKYNQIHY